jgi:hypothetical protein
MRRQFVSYSGYVGGWGYGKGDLCCPVTGSHVANLDTSCVVSEGNQRLQWWSKGLPVCEGLSVTVDTAHLAVGPSDDNALLGSWEGCIPISGTTMFVAFLPSLEIDFQAVIL